MQLKISYIIIFFFVAGIFLASCDVLNKKSENITDGVLIQTDQEQYSLPPEEWQGMPEGSGEIKIKVHLQNESAYSIFMKVPSFFITLEKKEDKEWKNLGAWYSLIAVASRMKEITPGEELSPIMELSLHNGIIEGPGLYRFQLKLYDEDSTDSQNLLPLSKRVSNTFEINE